MECLKRHLSARLTNRLSSYCADSLASLDLSALVLFPDESHELLKLALCNIGKVSQERLHNRVLPFAFDLCCGHFIRQSILDANILSNRGNLTRNVLQKVFQLLEEFCTHVPNGALPDQGVGEPDNLLG